MEKSIRYTTPGVYELQEDKNFFSPGQRIIAVLVSMAILSAMVTPTPTPTCVAYESTSGQLVVCDISGIKSAT